LSQPTKPVIKNHLYGCENWERETREICQAIRNKVRVNFTTHFWSQLEKRGLTVGEVYSIFKNGTAEIVQGHQKGTYALNGGKLNEDEIRVFYGVTNTGKVIHVVVALSGKKRFKFVTVYIPNLYIFKPDLKTLRPEWAFKEIKEAADQAQG